MNGGWDLNEDQEDDISDLDGDDDGYEEAVSAVDDIKNSFGADIIFSKR